MASYATSEPDAGSDVAGLKTRFDQARRRLRAQRAEVLDHQRQLRALLRGLRHRRIPRSGTRASRRSSSIATRPASRSARRRTSSGQRAERHRRSSSKTSRCPKANLLAPEGQGFKLAMETFNQTRPDIAAAAAGPDAPRARRVASPTPRSARPSACRSASTSSCRR